MPIGCNQDIRTHLKGLQGGYAGYWIGSTQALSELGERSLGWPPASGELSRSGKP